MIKAKGDINKEYNSMNELYLEILNELNSKDTIFVNYSNSKIKNNSWIKRIKIKLKNILKINKR